MVVVLPLPMACCRPLVIDIVDPYCQTNGKRLGKVDFEEFVAVGDENFPLVGPEDETSAIALNYTSGTTGNPKGVVSSHRGAYMNSLGNLLSWDMRAHSPFLHIVPMYHCNAWCFPWAITANAGSVLGCT